MTPGEHAETEIASQPGCWEAALSSAAADSARLPERGARVAVIGCGTSWFMGQAYAARREELGIGESDAFAASEFPASRAYDHVVAITRSGTTSEVLDALDGVRGRIRTTVVTAVADAPVADLADELLVLDYADERSVVQTRFATTALVLLRAHLGENLRTALSELEQAIGWVVEPEHLRRRQFTFLGTGWTVGLANEAALKVREASLSWADSYPAMDYRHGPISLADPDCLAWFLGEAPPGLADELVDLGAHVVTVATDPLVELVRIQKLAVALGRSKGLDPDAPRNLVRSVVLDGAAG